MKKVHLMDLPLVFKSSIKYTFTILIIFVFTTNGFSQECDEKTIARMIKSGLSDKTIEEQCGKIDEQVENKDTIEEEKVESKDTVEEEKVSEDDPTVDKRWRFGLGDGSGEFKYTNPTIPLLDGKFDHDLSGGTITINYFVLGEDNIFYGGGWSSVNVSGPETFSADAVSGYYTYYHSSIGYFDISITITSLFSNFYYGIYGYNYAINNEMSLQPHLRYGYKFVGAEWTEKTQIQGYSDTIEEYEEDFSQLGLDIVLPFVYKINKEYSIGADICICGASGEITSGSGKTEFSIYNVFNIFFDYHL